ncbi:MAG: hypothetical protein RMH84_06635 [Sulfolobales archaeon]|nr:hypothetical protein [Sulfolobales archaeon]MCX8209084.1 hypothetical protein [Sulfolobales archaeon]MDW8011247.1 hypothetical protein [Sulfolobales archaeon]
MDISRVWRALSKTEVPGFDIDVVSAGLVTKVRVSRDGSKIAVFIDFTGSDPSCAFCRFINHTLMKTVIERIKDSLRGVGFKEVFVVDARTGVEL